MPVIKVNFNIRVRQDTCALLRPFHRADGIVGKIITDPHKFEFLRIRQTVEIEVIHHQVLEGIGLHRGISWAFDIAAVTERLQKPRLKVVFPAPKSPYR